MTLSSFFDRALYPVFMLWSSGVLTAVAVTAYSGIGPWLTALLGVIAVFMSLVGAYQLVHPVE